MVVVLIVIAVLCVILAFLLGVLVAAGEESVSEHHAYLRGFRDGLRKARRESDE